MLLVYKIVKPQSNLIETGGGGAVRTMNLFRL